MKYKFGDDYIELEYNPEEDFTMIVIHDVDVDTREETESVLVANLETLEIFYNGIGMYIKYIKEYIPNAPYCPVCKSDKKEVSRNPITDTVDDWKCWHWWHKALKEDIA